MNSPYEDGEEDQIASWIATALRDLESGLPIDLDELCRERPARIAEVAAALGLRHELPMLQKLEQQPTSAEGRLLADRYRLEEPVGSGAAGTVWRAADERLHREVAVKLLHRGLFAGADGEARFHREAVVLAAHEHRHIVRIHDQGRTADGTTYLVTELLRGRALQAVLTAARQAMPTEPSTGPSMAQLSTIEWLQELLPEAHLESSWLRQAVRWTAELGEGLAAAHRESVCHRDVKPGNAFVRNDGSAVLLDFGIAARVGDASITRTHTVLGTPCYMAPEQAAGHSEPHPALDIYGLTATLYHLLTMRPPHEGDLQQVMVSLRLEDPTPANKLCPGLPRDLQAILDRGLERSPQRRYRTMADLVQDLGAFLDHAPVMARPLRRGTRLLRRIARRPAKPLAIAATTLAIVLGGIALPLWLIVEAKAAERERAECIARLPADLCIEGYPDQRALVPADERRDLLAELDGIYELDDRDLGIRLLRGATLLDFGELERAHRDFAAIADAADSDYVRELARRYAAARLGDHGGGVIDLEGLPAPTTTIDYFLAGFHALRARDSQRAAELLTHAEDYLPARDLRLLTLLDVRPRDPQRAITEASYLEGIYGRQTARTQHTLAAGHLHLKLYKRAIPYCRRSLELRPDRHGPWTNLGFAHLRLGQLDEALRCYRKAVELRPWLFNSLSGLTQTLRQLGRYDEARDVASDIADTGWREYELGNIELTRALAAMSIEDRPGQLSAAAAAAVHFGKAAEDLDSKNPKAGSLTATRMLTRALADDELTTALVPLLYGMRGDPRNARQIANLASVLANAELTADSIGRLRLWLLDLAIDLAPESPTYKDLRVKLLESLRSRSHR